MNLNRLIDHHHTPRNFTAAVAKKGDWYIGFVEEVPGVNAQEKTINALMNSLRLALKDILEVQREEILSSMPSRCREVTITL